MTENLHDISELRERLLPCACGKRVSLVNVQTHRALEEITHWTGDCPECGSHHTVFND